MKVLTWYVQRMIDSTGHLGIVSKCLGTFAPKYLRVVSVDIIIDFESKSKTLLQKCSHTKTYPIIFYIFRSGRGGWSGRVGRGGRIGGVFMGGAFGTLLPMKES